MRVAQSARGDAGALRLADQRAVEIQASHLRDAARGGLGRSSPSRWTRRGDLSRHAARSHRHTHRRRASGRHSAAGTGIGLSVAKRVALIHGGYVWVTSDEVEGTTFFAAIPASAQKRGS